MIIEAIAHPGDHIDAEQVFAQIQARTHSANIATVPLTHPQVLVLDEPTGGLDPRSRRTLIHLLKELPLTMLASTHDMVLVREIFPRMIILDEGRVVADGPTQVLMNDAALLEAHGLEKP